MGARKRSEHERAFTPIGLLAVISMLVMLRALLLPPLSRVRKQAQAVVCQERLRQLGIGLSVWMGQNDMGLAWGGIGTAWRCVVKPIAPPDMALRSSAARHLPGVPSPTGDTFHAYSYPMGRRDLRGSYGLNYRVFENIVERDGENTSGLGRWDNWRAKCAGRVPAFFDCATCTACPSTWLEPPDYKRAFTRAAMYTACINRYQGGINLIFTNGAVRKVGLKALWTLKWARDVSGSPWTEADGMHPEDWAD
ncbi:MAG: hypothetical protein RBS72_21690 [Sedimentisphaerales bacterium]|jgi:hypothetical protein|nr:hypothetical protein [Sedimentisphaerales bacterium]HOH65640.1 hypothetical protein [Sedimentisphaerales bacterium]HQA90103.1 hypothetical protein [Sedimentisphaerales bacterium]HQN35918.1 hypothetical protein [Sedimentisphaerales bacterium]